MDYEKKYRDLVEAIKELQEANPSDNGIQKWVDDIIPELKESEDERIRKEILTAFSCGHDNSDIYGHGITYGQVRAWLERQGKKKHVEWSEEDKDMLRMLLEMINYASDHYQHDDKATDIKAWVLKSLKDRVGCEMNCTTTKEWSKEDEATISRVISIVKWAAYSDHSHPILNDEGATELIDRLKSLRPQSQNIMSEDEFAHIVGYLVQDIVANEHMPEGEKQPTRVFVEKYYNKLRPQNRWKPSDEQMIAIKQAVKDMKESPCYDSELVSLFNDLKKLRTE